ncbi:YdeI/OmpD-associated family protein [Pontixanthobacter aquaemixtae]|uniref:Bacteriocin-protection, YdeI or OmpD-Associated n=1 Tax=Pontixanthobacter aquaemixtae TaxID=1958940 RepID=A0A844ZQG0_9SPHN|nr:YdeI/OmpD-associated family protein [Pontixanthobacter aquaemixtae]MXO90023.1 hypothetical protein [Pontixanthobacter aquaemixtae]
MAQAANPDFRHKTPAELRDILSANQELSRQWDSLTSLARNEWICWVVSAKKNETREKRLSRLQEEVADGKKRPCCWPGCPHRRESARNWVDP